MSGSKLCNRYKQMEDSAKETESFLSMPTPLTPSPSTRTTNDNIASTRSIPNFPSIRWMFSGGSGTNNTNNLSSERSITSTTVAAATADITTSSAGTIGPSKIIRKALSSIPISEKWFHGVEVYKISKTNGKLHKRYITFSPDKMAFFVTHAKVPLSYLTTTTTTTTTMDDTIEDDRGDGIRIIGTSTGTINNNSIEATLGNNNNNNNQSTRTTTNNNNNNTNTSIRSAQEVSYKLSQSTSIKKAYFKRQCKANCYDVSDWHSTDTIQVGVFGSIPLELTRSLKQSSSSYQIINTLGYKEHLVTLYHRNTMDSISFLISSTNDRDEFVSIISTIKRRYDIITKSFILDDESLLLRYLWYDLKILNTKVGMIDDIQFEKLCKRLNLYFKDYKDYFNDIAIMQPKNITSLSSTRSLLMSSLRFNNYANNSERSDYNNNYNNSRRKTKKSKMNSKKIGLNYDGVKELLRVSKQIQTPSTKIWETLFGETTIQITPKDLYNKFLISIQDENDTTINDAKTIIESYNRFIDPTSSFSSGGKRNNKKIIKTLTKHQFIEYLHSEFNNAYDPETQQQRELTNTILDKPLSHYWINSSHNTYLTGDQLKSKSSVQAYALALHRGCKCLELDVWDSAEPKKKKNKKDSKRKSSFLFGKKRNTNNENDENDENDNNNNSDDDNDDNENDDDDDRPIPIVFHGHTLTSKIQFRHILEVVNNYIERNPNTYPIILSLENHCSHPCQFIMAKDLNEIFGTKLYKPTKNDIKSNIDDGSGGGELPSPEQLRGKVVIKGKRPPEKEKQPTTSEEEEEDQTMNDGDDDDDMDEFDPYEVTEDQQRSSVTNTNNNNNNEVNKYFQEPSKIVPDLAKLTLFHGTKFKNFDTSINGEPSHMHSFSESKMGKIIKNGNKKKIDVTKLWRQYNINHMSRLYPAGTRIDSSNYNPILPWYLGCQLVALNFQKHDSNLILNDGLFRQNGNCGYVLKPDSIMNNNTTTTTTTNDNNTDNTPQRIYIRILSGRNLPKPKGVRKGEIIDPYVQVILHDVNPNNNNTDNNSNKKVEYTSTTFRTSTVIDNGFSPIWNRIKDNSDSNFTTFDVYTKDVAMLQFNLIDEDYGKDDKVASTAIPISCLRQGYRSIMLYDHYNTRCSSYQSATLLVRIDLNYSEEEQ